MNEWWFFKIFYFSSFGHIIIWGQLACVLSLTDRHLSFETNFNKIEQNKFRNHFSNQKRKDAFLKIFYFSTFGRIIQDISFSGQRECFWGRTCRQLKFKTNFNKIGQKNSEIIFFEKSFGKVMAIWSIMNEWWFFKIF